MGTNVAYFLSEKNKYKINVYDAGKFSKIFLISFSFSEAQSLSIHSWAVSGRSANLFYIMSFKTKKAESNAAVTSKANAGNFAPFAMKYGGNVETGMARLFLPGKELIHFFSTIPDPHSTQNRNPNLCPTQPKQ